MQDVTPPYYEMTVLSPSVFGDEILVSGMPVGNFFQFMWNAAGMDKKKKKRREQKKGNIYAPVLFTCGFADSYVISLTNNT